MVQLEGKIDDDDDDNIYDDSRCQRKKDCPINNDSGDHHSQIPEEDQLDVATPNRLMLEVLLQNQADWEAEQSLEQERRAAEKDRMAAERDQWAAERAKHTEQSTVGPGPNIYNLVEPVRLCYSARELDHVLDVLR